MKASALDYELPPELIAQTPARHRDESRLLVYERRSGAVRHRRFRELPEELSGELVVVNDTRVVPARLQLTRPTGGRAEVLLLERLPDGGDGGAPGDPGALSGGGAAAAPAAPPPGVTTWEALARPSARLRPGERLGPVELLAHLGDGRWRIRLHGDPAGVGEAPLPPYITAPLADPERYQTVYARDEGSAAAPTAGLHFTPELLARLTSTPGGVERVTLHVGLDTFRPLAVDDLAHHVIHGERYGVTAEAWERIRSAGRVLAVGTTTVRVLETVAQPDAPLAGRTELFIAPGHRFRRVDALLTNFHLPRSTLLALVMAFAGAEEVRELYRLAVAERYRFYSFGDAMLIL